MADCNSYHVPSSTEKLFGEELSALAREIVRDMAVIPEDTGVYLLMTKRGKRLFRRVIRQLPKQDLSSWQGADSCLLFFASLDILTALQKTRRIRQPTDSLWLEK